MTRAQRSCATDGKCDGAGGCRKYRPGTLCAAETCADNVYTPPLDLQRDRQCVAPDADRLRALRLQRRALLQRLHDRRATAWPQRLHRQLVRPQAERRLLRRQARVRRRATARRASAARTACASACKSCALPPSMGICTNVPDGQPDPDRHLPGRAAPPAAARNGKCEAGACQSYPQGTPCQAATCPANTTTLTPASDLRRRRHVRDAARRPPASRSRAAPPPASRPARPTPTARRRACAATAPAASSRPARSARDGTECRADICAQGVCCKTACSGTCMSCALAGTPGTCSRSRPDAADPAGQCRDRARPAAERRLLRRRGRLPALRGGHAVRAAVLPGGRDAPRRWRAPATAPAPASPPTTQSCAPYTCNGTGLPGGLRRRQPTASPACVCNAGSCGTEAPRPALRGAGANASAATASTASAARPPAAGPASRATSAGRPAPASRSRPATMSRTAAARPARPAGSTAPATARRVPPMAAPAPAAARRRARVDRRRRVGALRRRRDAARRRPVSCAPYVCGTGACKTTCATIADCVAGYTCQGYSCTNLKPNGLRVHGRRPSASAATAPTASAAARPLARAVTPAPSPGKQGTCSPIADGTVCGAGSATGRTACTPMPATCSAGQCVHADRATDCAPYACDAARQLVQDQLCHQRRLREEERVHG